MAEITQSVVTPAGRKRVGWLRWFFLILTTAWLAEEFLRAELFVVRAWGLQALILDGLMLYKLGELLVFVFLRPGWDATQQADYVARSKWLFWSGALLNAIAFFGLRSRIDWWWWPLALVALGLLLPLALKGLAARGVGWAGWLLVFVFFLLQAVAYFTAFLFNGYAFTPLPAPYPRPAASRVVAGSRTYATWLPSWCACTRTLFTPSRLHNLKHKPINSWRIFPGWMTSRSPYA